MTVAGDDLAVASRVSPVSLTGVSVCELARLVLVDQLRLAVTCTATGGSLSLFSHYVTPAPLLDLARAVIQRSGARFVVVDGAVQVSQAVGNADAAGFSQGAPEPVLGSVPVGDDGAFVAPLAAPDASAVAKSAIAGADAVSVTIAGGDAAQLRDLASSLGLSVSVVQLAGSAAVIGGRGEVELVRSITSDEAFAAHAMSVGPVSDALLQVVKDSSEVNADADPDTGLLLLSGRADQIARAVTVARALGVSTSVRSVEAAFVYGSDSDFLDLRAEFGLALVAGESGVFLGSRIAVGGAAFQAGLDAVQVRGGLRIEERPVISVRDGVEGVFQSGRDVPVVGAVSDEGRQSVEYRPVGTILRVKTSPTPDGRIVVAVYIEVSSVDGAGAAGSPSFARRSVSTQVVVRQGDVIALSGFTGARQERRNGRVLGIFPTRYRSDEASRLHVLLTVR